MIHHKYNICQSLVGKPNSKFFIVDIDKILIFQKWHHNTFIKIPATTEADILCKFTKNEWGSFFNAYIYKKLQ